MSTLYFGVDNSSHPESVHIPLISIEYRTEKDLEVRAFLDDIDAFTHLVFTSKHGAIALLKHVSVSAIQKKTIISIGKATTKKLTELGLHVDRTAEEETQEGVLHELNLLDLNGAYIGIPCSSRARKTLATLLAYRGVRHLIGYLYDTRLVKDATLPDLNTVQEVIFTSPSTVQAFTSYHTILPQHLRTTFQGTVTKRCFEEIYQV